MQRTLKWISFLAVVMTLGVWLSPRFVSAVGLSSDDADRIQKAFNQNTSNIVVETRARVIVLYPDLIDLEKHQVFKVELDNGHRLQVMHNLDEAPPVPVVVGSEIRLRGEYDWSPAGGTIHWTHDDPARQREGGWIEYQDRVYR